MLEPLLLFSTLSLVAAGLTSLVVFLLSLQQTSPLCHTILRQWALAFFLMFWVKIPSIFVSLGIITVIADTFVFHSIASLFHIIGSLLLYRGTAMLFTKNKFWLNIFPTIFFFFFVLFIAFLSVIVQVLLAYQVLAINALSYAAILFLITVLSRKFLTNGKHALLPLLPKSGITLIVVGFILFLAIQTYTLWMMTFYPVDLWYAVFLTKSYIQLISAASYFLVLSGFILSNINKKLPC